MDSRTRLALNAFIAAVADLPEHQHAQANSLLVDLSDWIEQEKYSSDFSQEIERVQKYLKRITSPARHAKRSFAPDILRYLITVRGSARSHLPKADLRKAQTHFWKVLGDNAEMWDSKEISHLLSYSMGHQMHVDFRQVAPKTVVQLHHQYFKSLPTEHRDYVFGDLLNRFGSEREFRRAVLKDAELRK